MPNPIYTVYKSDELVFTTLEFKDAYSEWSKISGLAEIRVDWGCMYPERSYVMQTASDMAHYAKQLYNWEKADTVDEYWDSQPEREKSVKEHVDPKHYQSYLALENEQLQWLETMQYLPNFRDPNNFKAAVELQGRKYLDRLGNKDFEVQELLKSIWYWKFLAAYIANGNKPIRVKDIDTLLSK